MVNCRSCGAVVDVEETFCEMCGTPLRAPPPPREKVYDQVPRASTILGVILICLAVVTAVLSVMLSAEMNESLRLREEAEDSDEIADLVDEIEQLKREKEDLRREIDDLEAQNRYLKNENSEWWYIYRLRAGEYPYDLVTPEDPAIVSKSFEILGTDADGDLTWGDMYKINDWVSTNIDYSRDPYIYNPDNYGEWDYWQTPKETLKRGEGDCDDHANLALSLMLAEENVGWLWGARVIFDGESGHVGIFVNVVDDQMFVFDPTWGWQSSRSQSEPLALDEWANRGGHSSVTKVRELYSDTESHEFDTLQEFYDWF